MKNDRLFHLLYVLLEKGTVSAPELAALLEVSVRTVYRDVEALSMAGVPIHAVAGRNGGVSLSEGYTFDQALLSDDEQNQILFAIQSLQATDQQVGELLAKLGGIFRKPAANWIEVDFSRWGFGRVDNRKFEMLKVAILRRQVLQITYCGTTGETTSRAICPFKLIFKAKNWYLQAYCQKAEDYRLFKVNRILSLEITGQTFAETFDDAPSPEQEFFLPPMEQTSLQLRFRASLAYRVYDEFDPACIVVLPDGALLVTAIMPVDDWVYGYLLTFGDGVTILAPQTLRSGMTAFTKKIAEHYQP